MSKNLSLLIPDTNMQILNNLHSEKVNYINIPEGITADDLKSDIKLGASQFSELTALLEMKNEPKYILISTNNLEQGYMAVSYLASAFNKRRGLLKDDPDDEEYYDYDFDDEAESIFEPEEPSEWTEDPFKIPIIDEDELVYTVSDAQCPFPMGNTLSLGAMIESSKRPYWMKCRHEAVCIKSAVARDIFDGSVIPTDNKRLEKALKFFSNNDKVYILNVDEKNESYKMSDTPCNAWLNSGRKKWNYIVLSFTAREANVIFEKNSAGQYMKMVFKGILDQKGVRTCRNFNYSRISEIVLSMDEKDKCSLMEKLVNYALSFPGIKNNELTLKNFAFIDRFADTSLFSSDKNKKTPKAYQQMEKEIIGMDNIKKKIRQVINVMKFQNIRSQNNLNGGSYHNVHVMLGAPGTAKTTMAKFMGQIMVEEHLLPDSRFICVNGAELKGKYVGHSAPKTKQIFEEHDIIVIDEAYSLVGDNGEYDTFSNEAISQLIIELEAHSTDKLIIFAGYGGKNVSEKDNKMKDFIKMNPGIKSRINSTFNFDSYTSEQMIDIFFRMAENQDYTIDKDSTAYLKDFFDIRSREQNFGNGREARSLLENSAMHASDRLFSTGKTTFTENELKEIQLCDVLGAIEDLKNADNIQNFENNNTIGF